MQLLLLDCDTINHPSQIGKTCLAPIVVYLKIASTRVLQRLIKNRGKLRKKNAGVQVAAAEKLHQCPNEAFDYIIEQNTLEAATEGLINFLEGYWNATHPQLNLSKAERLLGSIRMDVNEPDSERPLVPMTPGRPGLSVVTKAAIDAGFTSQEISALTGARATAWATEGGQPVENELGLTATAGMTTGAMVGDMDGMAFDQLDHESGQYGPGSGKFGLMAHWPPKSRLHINAAAHAAAMAAAAAGLVPKSRPAETTPDEVRSPAASSTPGLAMGIGMGLANGVAATINAALFQTLNPSVGRANAASSGAASPSIKQPAPSPTVALAAAVTIKPPPLKDLGIHQVEGSDGTRVYQSRSARQAKERQAELDRVRREAEAKALAVQATVAGRRRRRGNRERERIQYQQGPVGGPFYGTRGTPDNDAGGWSSLDRDLQDNCPKQMPGDQSPPQEVASDENRHGPQLITRAHHLDY